MPKLPAANSMACSRPSLSRAERASGGFWHVWALLLAPPPVPTPAKHGWKPVSICDTAPVVGLVTKRLAPVSNE